MGASIDVDMSNRLTVALILASFSSIFSLYSSSLTIPLVGVSFLAINIAQSRSMAILLAMLAKLHMLLSSIITPFLF